MKSTLLVLFAALTGFAAGWFFRAPAAATGDGPGPRPIVQAGDTALSASVEPDRDAALTGAPPVEIRPLESLEELLAAIDAVTGMGAVGGITLMELAPRLFVTGLPTIRRLVDELAEFRAGHPGDDEPYTMLHAALMFRWLTLQPEEAVGFSLAHPALLGDAEEINVVGLAYLAKVRPNAVNALLPLLPESESGEIAQYLTLIEAMSDPGGILRDPQRLESLDGNARAQLVGMWMRSDSAAALSWMQNLPEAERQQVSPTVFARWMESDQGAALAWFQSLPDGDEKTAVGNSVANSLEHFKGSREELEAEIATLPSEMANDVRLRWIGENVEDTASAAEQLGAILRQSSSSDGEAAMRAVSRLTRSFTRDNEYADGSAWELSLPEGSGRNVAINLIAGNWAGSDPTAASTWVAALPPGTDRDNAATALVQQIRNDDPEAAVIWAQSIGNRETRRDQTLNAYQHWLRTDPLSAIDSISAIAPADRERIFSDPARQGGPEPVE